MAQPHRLALFRPLLPGTTAKDRIWACVGAGFGILLTGLICSWVTPQYLHIPLLVAPMGASAVLIFAVPASPMAQPWPLIGGNVISALVGIAVARLVPDIMIAAGIAAALAIAVMSLFRCLHPPGGAAAVTAVIGGSAVVEAGWSFALLPVGLNAVTMGLAAWLFHRFSGHSYPHRVAPLPMEPIRDEPVPHPHFIAADIETALAEFGESLDVSAEDIERLIHRVEENARTRFDAELAEASAEVRI